MPMWSEMIFKSIFLLALLAFALVTMPASAFTAKTLVISIEENGDSNINFNYHLTWMENLAYSLIPHKEWIVESALNSKFPQKEVDDIRVSRTNTYLTVKGFAKVTTTGSITTYKTPIVSFRIAEDLLDNYPRIKKAIKPDFSPEKTIVKFPGSGDQYTYTNVEEIPRIIYSK
jgi:hypothetical protein